MEILDGEKINFNSKEYQHVKFDILYDSEGSIINKFKKKREIGKICVMEDCGREYNNFTVEEFVFRYGIYNQPQLSIGHIFPPLHLGYGGKSYPTGNKGYGFNIQYKNRFFEFFDGPSFWFETEFYRDVMYDAICKNYNREYKSEIINIRLKIKEFKNNMLYFYYIPKDINQMIINLLSCGINLL